LVAHRQQGGRWGEETIDLTARVPEKPMQTIKRSPAIETISAVALFSKRVAHLQ
jgi:hypothetical protein